MMIIDQNHIESSCVKIVNWCYRHEHGQSSAMRKRHIIIFFLGDLNFSHKGLYEIYLFLVCFRLLELPGIYVHDSFKKRKTMTIIMNGESEKLLQPMTKQWNMKRVYCCIFQLFLRRTKQHGFFYLKKKNIS